VNAAKAPGWLQTPLWEPPTTWTAPNIADLPSWQDARRVCLDVECRDDDLHKLGPGVRRGGYVAGVAFAIEDGPAHYLPIRHEGGGNLDPDAVWQYLRAQVAVFSGEAVFNYAPYDLDYLWQNDVPIGVKQRVRDTQVAEPVIDELQTNYNLDAICARRGLPGKDERVLREHAKAWGVDPKRGLWRLHAGAVGAYGEQDVRAPLALLRRQEHDIDELGLWDTYNLESAVTPALMRMTRLGIRVDLDELDRVEAWARERRQSYVDLIHHLTGIRVNSLANSRELAPALSKRGIKVPMPVHKGTGKPTPSIQKLWLQQIDDDVARAIISGREFDKLLGTYVGGVRKHLIGDRLHPTFKQLASDSDDAEDEDEAEGARFGRVSAKHPNIQSSMKRSKEIQKRWRKVYVADRKKNWYAGDYSQQEPRWIIHYSEECKLNGARQAGDTLRRDPLYDCYQMLVDLVPDEKRDDLKEVYLGRGYGMGGGKMAKKLKKPTVWKTNSRTGYEYEAAGPEAQAIIDKFDRAVPYVKALMRLCQRAGEDKKYIRGVDGRRIHFELDENGQIKHAHKGLNKLIQYAAAWQTKKALVALDAEGYPLQMTVHDEFDYSDDDDDRARHMAEVMVSVAPQLRVPSRVDLKKGTSYGDTTAFCTVTSNVQEAA
jgi:DNA polymerase I-like protein with 3'-5' exonuclease and polymerase domains